MQSLPIIISVIPFGLIFGVMARQTHLLDVASTTLMSAAVFAGSSQLVALSLWQLPLAVASIVTTTFLVNLRLTLMSASLRPWFEKLSVWQAYGSLLFLTDAGWALQLQEFQEDEPNASFLIGNGIAQYLVWVSSSISGYWLGAAITSPERWGLDFVVPASFLALLIGLWRGKSDALPWLSAVIAAFAASQMIPGNWFIIIGGLTGSLTGAFFQKSAEEE